MDAQPDQVDCLASDPPTNVSMLTNDQLNRLEGQAIHFLKYFNSLYVKNYGAAILDDILIEKDPITSPWKLTRRDYDSIPRRRVLINTYVQVKSGAGPGNFSDWERLFLVERQSNDIDLFSSKKDFRNGHEPVYTIQTAGYKVILNTSQHYEDEMLQLAIRLGLTDIDIKVDTAELTGDSWALSRPLRTDYIFKEDNNTGSCCESWRSLCCSCCCCCQQSSDSEDLESSPSSQLEQHLGPTETEISNGNNNNKRLKLIDMMKRSVGRGGTRSRTKKVVSWKAFVQACKQHPATELKTWKKPGAYGPEEEILVDLLMEICLPELCHTVIQDRQDSAHSRTTAWYSIQDLLQSTLETVVGAMWQDVQASVRTLHENIDLYIRQNISEILAVLPQIESQLKDRLGEQLRSLLTTHIVSLVEPLLTCLDRQMKDGLWYGRAILSEQIRVSELPSHTNDRNAVLDKIPRDKSNIKRLRDPLTSALNESLLQLKQAVNNLVSESDVLKVGLGLLDVEDMGDEAERIILELMDSVVFTLQVRLDDEDQPESCRYLQDMLLLFDEDASLVHYSYIRGIVEPLLISIAKRKVIAHSERVLDRLTDIPAPKKFENFLTVDHCYDTYLEGLVCEIIDKALVTRGYTAENRP